jgi:hypothetical protein
MPEMPHKRENPCRADIWPGMSAVCYKAGHDRSEALTFALARAAMDVSSPLGSVSIEDALVGREDLALQSLQGTARLEAQFVQ